MVDQFKVSNLKRIARNINENLSTYLLTIIPLKHHISCHPSNDLITIDIRKLKGQLISFTTLLISKSLKKKKRSQERRKRDGYIRLSMVPVQQEVVLNKFIDASNYLINVEDRAIVGYFHSGLFLFGNFVKSFDRLFINRLMITVIKYNS